LPELAALVGNIHHDAAMLLIDAPWSRAFVSSDGLRVLRREHQLLEHELAQRYNVQDLAFPETWAVEGGTSFLLYALVRVFRPEVVVEVGVANGHSSYYIIHGLKANAVGRLFSLDVEPGVGGLLSAPERALWDLRIINGVRGAKSFLTQLAGLPRADLCFHDADHGYLLQRLEFSALWTHLNEPGVFVGDDVDASYAFVDFCDSFRQKPALLLDGRKVVGVVARSPEELSSSPTHRF
jgi:predicted O-methyltransferase YrrM